MYISPVGFSSSVVPEEWRLLYSLNPMVGVIDGFRWAILRGTPDLYWPGLGGFACRRHWCCLRAGCGTSARTERRFADVI